jgi:hypothetical protein
MNESQSLWFVSCSGVDVRIDIQYIISFVYVFLLFVHVFLLLSMYSYCCLCILIIVHVFLLFSMYSYYCLCILIIVHVFLLFVHVFLFTHTYYCPCILIIVHVFLLLSMYSYCSSMFSYLWILTVVCVFLDAATLTEGFPCFFLGCKANARV